MATPDTSKVRAGSSKARGSRPAENEPGHHPDVEQDKPIGRRPRVGAAVDHDDESREFAFAFQPALMPFSAMFGVLPPTTHVRVNDDLEIRFGPWWLSTPIDNVEDAHLTGPYQPWKVAGPPHLSLKDRGITFATSTKAGVCIRFREPVAALLPARVASVLRHPAVTVTVDRPSELVDALRARRRPGD